MIFLQPTFCLGAYGPGATPVPIPNTAVKLGRVDGSMAKRYARVDRRQDRVLEDQNKALEGLISFMMNYEILGIDMIKKMLRMREIYGKASFTSGAS